MGRDYKFKGRRIDNGEWVYGSLTHCHDEKGNITIIPFGTNSFISVDLETVGQYTGRKDKVGVEIYDGGILKVPDHYETPENTYATYHNELVDYADGCFRLGGQPMYEDATYISNECEVIGNIHQHPELLKEGEGQ